MAPAVPSSSSTCSTSRNLISRSTQRESSVDRRAATGRPTVDRSPVDMPAVARIRHHDLDPTVGARGSTARYLPVPPGITRPTGVGRGTTCPGRGRALGAGVPRGLRRWQGHGQGDPAMADNLVTDLYEATMAASYVRRGMTGPATFSLFTRRLPEQRGFLVAAGLADAVDRLLAFELTGVDVIALADQLGCPRSLFSPLQGMRFTGDVWAVPEGRVVLADEPLLEVTAPLPEAQFVETLVLNAVCYQTLLASKAARCVLAAEGRPVVDFSLRRAHGEEAGLRAARAAAIAGFVATSNVAAALRYELRATGTMAHSYVQAFPSEEEAFRAFATDFPAAPVFLVDTFDLVDGVHAAARVIEELGLADRAGIRIDSGDMEDAARTARAILDEHGLRRVRIVASGGLDEFLIDRCIRREVPIDVFAVGTRFGVSADAPVLDAAYKLVQVGDR